TSEVHQGSGPVPAPHRSPLDAADDPSLRVKIKGLLRFGTARSTEQAPLTHDPSPGLLIPATATPGFHGSQSKALEQETRRIQVSGLAARPRRLSSRRTAPV